LLKAPEIGIWRRTSPFAILFFIGRILRLIAKNAWQSLAPLFALLVTYQGDLVSKLILGASAFALIVTVGSVLSYWFFRFKLLDDSILIRQGVIKKKQLDIKFERIQGINTQQNIVYRYLGLVTVAFDTAGSAGSEGNLPAVTRAFAESLRSQISGDTSGEEAVAADTELSGDALVHLDWRDMVRIGLADRRALLVFAVAGPLFERIADNAEQAIADSIAAAARYGLEIDTSNGVWIVIAAVLILLILLALISIAAAFLRYHDFQLFLDNRSLRSHGGLLTRHEHSMDLGKIQTLRLQQGIVQNWLGRFRMTARQATSKGGADAKQRYFDIPVVTVAQADELRPLLLGPEGGALTQDPRSGQFAAVSPHYMRSRILFVGILPALLATTFFSLEIGLYGLLFLLWLPLVAAFAFRSWRRAGYLHNDDEIVRRSGLLGYRTVGLLFRKVQRVSVTQSRYQRRKNLASLRLYMASGSVRIPYIKHETAEQLRDYILYKVESSDKAWH
jgi:putative membrane protein